MTGYGVSGIHLRRVGAVQPDDVPGELRDRDVHPEADAEVRDPALAGHAAGRDLALPPARPEPARDEDAVRALELGRGLLRAHALGVDPADAHVRAVVDPGVLERLVDGEVRVLELHVLADERDLDLAVALADPLRRARPTRRGRPRRRPARAARTRARRAPGRGADSARGTRRSRSRSRSRPATRRRRRARSSRGCRARAPRRCGRRRCPGGYRCVAAR